jgi:hypothetical protein
MALVAGGVLVRRTAREALGLGLGDGGFGGLVVGGMCVVSVVVMGYGAVRRDGVWALT